MLGIGTYQCGSNEFLCASGDQCIRLEQKCDYIPHCKDYSDETLCDFHIRLARKVVGIWFFLY